MLPDGLVHGLVDHVRHRDRLLLAPWTDLLHDAQVMTPEALSTGNEASILDDEGVDLPPVESFEAGLDPEHPEAAGPGPLEHPLHQLDLATSTGLALDAGRQTRHVGRRRGRIGDDVARHPLLEGGVEHGLELAQIRGVATDHQIVEAVPAEEVEEPISDPPVVLAAMLVPLLGDSLLLLALPPSLADRDLRVVDDFLDLDEPAQRPLGDAGPPMVEEHHAVGRILIEKNGERP